MSSTVKRGLGGYVCIMNEYTTPIVDDSDGCRAHFVAGEVALYSLGRRS